MALAGTESDVLTQARPAGRTGPQKEAKHVEACEVLRCIPKRETGSYVPRVMWSWERQDRGAGGGSDSGRVVGVRYRRRAIIGLVGSAFFGSRIQFVGGWQLGGGAILACHDDQDGCYWLDLSRETTRYETRVLGYLPIRKIII